MLEIKDLSVRYGKQAPTIEHFNLNMKKGEIISVVGESGSGKTTIVNLIPRFFETTEGRLLINGHDIKNISLKKYRDLIGIVPQESFLFSGTISENISFGKENVSQEEIVKAAKMANAYEFIKELPEGFETEVGERGVMLSGGQKQRIAIARAILNDTKVIIFDEATSSLDNISQKVILQNIKPFLKNKVVIIVAHRLSTIKDADNIYIMNNGEVIEEGSHDELLLNKGAYFSMLNTKYIEEIAN